MSLLNEVDDLCLRGSERKFGGDGVFEFLGIENEVLPDQQKRDNQQCYRK